MDSGEIEVTSVRGDPVQHQRPRRTRTPRRRLLITAGCAIGLILAISGLLLSTQRDPHVAIDTLLGISSPTPTAPLPLGAGIFFVEHRVPWGVLTVDGRPNPTADLTMVQPVQPGNNNSDVQVSFLLARGHHTVVYSAPPFSTLHCVITVPAAAHDTCPLAQPDDQTRGQIIGAARILDLGSTPAKLPSPAMADLVAAIGALIVVSTPPAAALGGELYLGTDGKPHAFAHDAQATLFREPWIAAPPGGTACDFFLCPVPDFSAPATAWSVMVAIRQGFHYAAATSADNVPAQGPLTPPVYNAAGVALADQMPLLITWSGAWHVTVDPAAPDPTMKLPLTCHAALQLLSIREYGATAGDSPPMGQVAPIAAANPAAGCLSGLAPVNPDGSLGTPIHLLYRFGLLLSLDAVGSNAFPDLPHADASEQALAQQILAQAR